MPLEGGVPTEAGAGMSPQMQLLMQYMGAAAPGMASGNLGAAAQGMNAITTQTLANKNYLKLMQSLLGGASGGADLPEGAKISMDRDGTTMKLPSSALKSLGNNLSDAQTGESGYTNPGIGDGVQFAPRTTPASDETVKSPYVNPSSSPLSNLTAADLAGLTPSDLNQALQFKLMRDELAGKKETAKSAAVLTREKHTWQKRNADVSYLNALKSFTKDERTAAVQNFEYATENGFTGTFAEFQRDTRTTHEKDYDASVKGGYKGTFHEWLRDMTALGGGLTLGEKKEVEEMKDVVASKSYFTDPKGLTSDIDKYINSEDVQNELFQYAADPQQSKIKRAELEAAYVREKLIGAGAEILGVTSEGTTLIWKVKYSDGSTGEVRRGF